MRLYVKQNLSKSDISVYCNEERIPGFIGITDGYIEGIFVLDDHQSRGIGKELLNHAKERHTYLTLHAYKKNTRAIAFYLREGFRIIRELIDNNTKEYEVEMKWTKKTVS